MTWQERILVGWVGPRGVVMAAVAGVFGPVLAKQGYAGAEELLPLAFALIFVTVIVHGLTLEPLSRRLGLSAPSRGGLLIAGATPWSQGLAAALHDQEIPVMVADSSWQRLRGLRYQGVAVYYGELLSEHAAASLELGEMETLLAATDNDAYNALVCRHYAPELGHQSVFQLAEAEASEQKRPAPESRGRTAFAEGLRFEELQRDWYRGLSFQTTRITETYDLDAFLKGLPPHALPIGTIDSHNRVRLLAAGEALRAEAGARVVWFGCKKECR